MTTTSARVSPEARANAQRGEIAITIDGQPYTLVLNTNALVLLQQVCTPKGKPITTVEEIYAAVNQQSLFHIRAFFWAALQKYHPAITQEAAGDLIDAAGGFAGMNELLGAVNGSAMPDRADVQELSSGGNPPKARTKRRRRGTGDVFSSMPGPSV